MIGQRISVIVQPTNPRFRLEQKPQEPSELSIRQLMRECKEVLRLAVIERQKYISRVRAAIFDAESDRDFLDVFEQGQCWLKSSNPQIQGLWLFGPIHYEKSLY